MLAYKDFNTLSTGYFRLKHNQYKKDANQLKNFLVLKLPSFFLHRVGDGKKAAISKSRDFSTELRRSYIDCTLERVL